MALVQQYALRCDNCNACSRAGGTSWSADSGTARKIATHKGGERLHHPLNVRRGYVDPNSPSDQRRRLDYCPACAPSVQRELIEIQRNTQS
jgi:hypothetical protein